MRIAYFSESIPPLVDGVSRTLVRLAETLLAENVEFRFFSPQRPDATVPWRDRVYRVASVPFPPYRYYRMALPFSLTVEQGLNRFRPDIVHVVSPTPFGFYAVITGRRRNIPVVSSYHTHWVAYFRYYGFKGWEDFGWSLGRWFYNRCTRTYVPTARTAQDLREKGIRNVEIWPRGVDTGEFSPAYRSDELRRAMGAEDLPVLLFVGRPVKEKDLIDLVAASHLLRSWGYRFKLALVGEGPMKEELRRRLPEAHFPGHVGGADLARWYASADIFVFPSTTETFGNVILEAFASGLPAVAVARGGPCDLVVPGANGLLARPNDPPDLARKIRLLLDAPDYAKQLGRSALQSVGRYQWSAANRLLLESYDRIIVESRRRRIGVPAGSAEPV